MFIIGDAVRAESFKAEIGGFFQFSAVVKSFKGNGQAVVEDSHGENWTVECRGLRSGADHESQA